MHFINCPFCNKKLKTTYISLCDNHKVKPIFFINKDSPNPIRRIAYYVNKYCISVEIDKYISIFKSSIPEGLNSSSPINHYMIYINLPYKQITPEEAGPYLNKILKLKAFL